MRVPAPSPTHLRGLFIAVAGPIGAGKSEYAKLLQRRTGAHLEEERFADNPFLANLYEHGCHDEDVNLKAELWFLDVRARQLQEIEARLAGGESVVTDWALWQSLFYAEQTLSGDQTTRYTAQVHAVAAASPRPDRILVVNATTDTLLARIHGRARPMESEMPRDYIDGLRLSYERLREAPWAPSLFIDTTNLPITTCETARESAENYLWQELGFCPVHWPEASPATDAAQSPPPRLAR
jgi:deoxyadenosine/deoxycytidine kinase